MYSPLDQFEIFSIHKENVESLTFTNSAFFIVLIFVLLNLLFKFSLHKNTNIFANNYNYFLYRLFSFVKELVKENLGTKYMIFFPLIFFLFNFILFSNMVGMVPYSFTVTSHIMVTFTLSFAFFWGINLLGIRKHGFHFLSLFLPGGSPIMIAPFLVIIELVSYIARVFSLAIRLFANLMSGHTLLKILSNFGWLMLSNFGFWVIASLVPILIVFAVTGLEIAIAFLQAYVFTILICIYLNDSLNLH
jgi:ATP synthase subunit 6